MTAPASLKANLKANLKSSLVAVSWTTLIAAVIGGVIGATVAWSLDGLPMGYGIIQGIVAGGLIGGLSSFFGSVYPTLKSGRWLARLSFSQSVLVKSVINFFIIVMSMRFGASIFYTFDGTFGWTAPEFVVPLIISGSLIVFLNLVLEINRMLGQRVLLNFITGAYHHPREEERMFLFLDLVGSTGIAERLGALRFHALLDTFFRGLGDRVSEYKGEIHKYVGDEVIISWPVKGQGKTALPVACYFAIMEDVAENRHDYAQAFGLQPGFRAALHAGTVVTGEIGGLKREIVFLGDTVNTTARIMQSCDASGEEFLVSKTAMALLDVPAGITCEERGPVKLRGREQMIELCRLRTSEPVIPG